MYIYILYIHMHIYIYIYTYTIYITTNKEFCQGCSWPAVAKAARKRIRNCS